MQKQNKPRSAVELEYLNKDEFIGLSKTDSRRPC